MAKLLGKSRVDETLPGKICEMLKALIFSAASPNKNATESLPSNSNHIGGNLSPLEDQHTLAEQISGTQELSSLVDFGISNGDIRKRDVTADSHIKNPNESLITQHDDVERPRMFDLVDEAFGYIQPKDLNKGTQDGSYESADEFPKEEIEYQKLKDDASRPLYPSCSPADTIKMRTYKDYVKNLKRVEGCITNCYILDEAILYCMGYIRNGRKGTHKRGLPTFMDDDADKEQPLDKGNLIHLETLKYEQFENSKMSTLKRLVDRLSFKMTSYKVYRVNGFVFHTADTESCKTTQNSGVKMKAMANFVDSVRDQNPREAETIYYGIVKEIIELDYYDFPQTVFYCDWVRVEDKVNGCTFNAKANLTFVNLQKLKRNSKVDDEPYYLASQASQVFYCQDPTRTDWSVVIDALKRLDKGIDAYEKPLAFEIGNPFTSSMIGLINENVNEDEEITEGSWMMISPSQSTPNPSEPLPIPAGRSHEHSTTSGGDSSKPKIPLKLLLLGHVVGKNLAKFMSRLGNLVREHIPPYYPDSPVVPDRFKDTVWQIICEEYVLPEAAKRKLMKSANNLWRNGMKILKKKYDEWDTNEARKKNYPKKTRPKNWVRFVDLTSTEEVKAFSE
ncbi:hypothetical protein GIB67_035784 [Kingdonia uniflora]|uniref:DUF4216 domain-containing protein n=1 Tax=Kingdonia uniflora TaxID=39325 RepID=A0A7J7MJK0_9MAGN|nr:hypothetical protein GIB67_035784 [Kingdonia uniflora]